MKLIGNIEVSGITRIVFYNTGEAWVRSEPNYDIGEEPMWFLESKFDSERVKTHGEMMAIVQRKVWDPSMWRIWIHGNSMNIVPDDSYEE